MAPTNLAPLAFGPQRIQTRIEQNKRRTGSTDAMDIRRETPEDIRDVRRLSDLVFGGPVGEKKR